MKKFINFKDPSEIFELQEIDPRLFIILADVNFWANSHNLECTITRLIDGMIEGVSKTDIHSTGRAFDMRSLPWPEIEKKNLIDYINKKYAEKWGTGPQELCVILHTGTAEHFHFQVKG